MLKLFYLNNQSELRNHELHMIKGGGVEPLECHGPCSCPCVNSQCTCDNKNASNKRSVNK